jgi:hypothetical protein
VFSASAESAGQASYPNDELTVGAGRLPRLVFGILDLVPRSRAESISSREQMETSGA